MEKNTEYDILRIILKQFTRNWTITGLSHELHLSRVGVWKILKKMDSRHLILLSSLGEGKTNVFHVKLNWENPIMEKILSLTLTEEAMKHKRWVNNFEDVGELTEFTILYGSTLISSKEANDIDLLNIVMSKNKFLKLEKILRGIEKTQMKKIHSENLTKSELSEEIKKLNLAFIDAIKKGVVLFGQEKFIKFIKNLY